MRVSRRRTVKVNIVVSVVYDCMQAWATVCIHFRSIRETDFIHSFPFTLKTNFFHNLQFSFPLVNTVCVWLLVACVLNLLCFLWCADVKLYALFFQNTYAVNMNILACKILCALSIIITSFLCWGGGGTPPLCVCVCASMHVRASV